MKVQTVIPVSVHRRIERIARERKSTVRNVLAFITSKAAEAHARNPELFAGIAPDGRRKT